MTNFWQMSNWTPSMYGWTKFGVIMLTALMLWSLVWKGIALWKSARLSHKGWFIVLLIVNTVGILEIIYIFAVAKKKENSKMVQ